LTFRIKSLEQRLVVFLLLPVALLLFLTGFLGFLYARNVMLREWREAAVLKLERAAHHLEMRLTRPVEWIQLFHSTAGGRGGPMIQAWLLDQIRRMDGVTSVDLQWLQTPEGAAPPAVRGPGKPGGSGGPGTRFHQGKIAEVTSPRLDARTGETSVDLVSELKDEDGDVVGRLRVSVGFDYLMQDLVKLGWWQSDQACLVDISGHYLAHTSEMTERSHLGETGDPLEAALLREMKEKPFGTVMGPGNPPKMVGGFYRIPQADWAVVMLAPGEKVLSPIIQFRTYYFLAGAICIFLILLLIRITGVGMARSIRELSTAADRIARGHYGEPLQVRTSDEIGRLTRSFNQMVEGLKERDFISNTFGRYVDQEVARELLKKPEARRLGGEKRMVAILMSDIRGFTPLADSMKPEGTIKFLNQYFARMIETVQRHKGIIVDFFGDGLLVFFDPLDGPVPPAIRNSVRCALDMQSAMEALNREMAVQSLPKLQVGVGVNAGEVVVGNIGSEQRAKYGIVGSPVNMTERIQAAAGGGEVVISETVLAPLSEEVRIKRSFHARLRGIDGESSLHVVDGMSDPPASARA
jgi:adenylate cyclase